MGDVTFYKGQNGSFARQKGGVEREKILNDPSFQRVRENLAEFARAATVSNILKGAFREIILRSKDLRTHNRIYALAVKVVKSDLVSKRGMREFKLGDHSLMEEFQFNINATWNATVFAKYLPQYTDTEVGVAFETFIPSVKIARPTGATDVRFFLAACAINTEEKVQPTNLVYSQIIKMDQEPLTGLVFSIPRILIAETIQVYALGIEYLQEVNGAYYPLNDKSHNAAKIILTD
jgi:hypothetical protein